MTLGKILAILMIPALLILAGCSSSPPRWTNDDSAPERTLDPDRIADAVPRVENKSKRGNPDSYVVFGKRYYVMESSRGFSEKGIASWYGTKFHGRSTSSGEPYDMYKMTAAHKSLPLPTYVEVENLRNGRTTVVRVNDRGPFHDNRIIDLSYAAATKLGIVRAGTGLVRIRAITPGEQSVPEPGLPNDSSASANAPVMYLQVGAFSNRPNAQRLRNKLSQTLQQGVRIAEVERSADTPVYRVQIGPLTSVSQVDSVSEKLAAEGLTETHVVIE